MTNGWMKEKGREGKQSKYYGDEHLDARGRHLEESNKGNGRIIARRKSGLYTGLDVTMKKKSEKKKRMRQTKKKKCKRSKKKKCE